MIKNKRYLFDQEIRKKHKVELISGSDEVGRGAMAGPIVVCSLILKPKYNNIKIKDSKLLTSQMREQLYDQIIENCLAYSIKVYDSHFVDKNNPKKTSQIGMKESIKSLKIKPNICLIDGENIELSGYKCLKVIKGDNISMTIGAASILAKVYRDRIMKEYSLIYPKYCFEKNKGYCTLEHQSLVQQHGIVDIHRVTYKPIKFLKEKNMIFDRNNQLYQEWMNANHLEEELKNELLNASDEELNAAFSVQLEFGTAGIRGVLGAGPGRFNFYTIKKVTISYAKLLISKYPEELHRGVVIGHDNRKNSKEFAQLTAEILTSYGIKAYLFEENKMKPTPVVSFATKDLGCIGGIVITASHNPAIYNGYKIYDQYGCQLIDQDTKVISEYMEEVHDILNWNFKRNEELLEFVPKNVLENYKDMIANLQFYKNQTRDNFKMIYSAVNGTGTEFTPPLLRSFGYEVIEVEEHAFEDPTFKNVGNPNPEFETAWKIPLEYGQKYSDASIIIMQDPDADRIGCAINHNGQWIRLDGNQTGPILIEWKLSQMKLNNLTLENPVMYSSFVTSNLGDRIANETYNVKVIKTLTGFKWMGSEILKEPQRNLNFVFAYEESYGYVLDSSTRDKDGIQAATMLAEAAWYYKKRNKTLIDVLNEIFKKYGYYYTYTENLNFKPEEIKLKVEPIMKKLREEEFTTLGGLKLNYAEDYIDGLYNMPGQNLIKFYFEEGSWFAVRPSGTEPKIKIYFVCVDNDEESAKNKCKKIFNDLKEFLEI